MKFSICVVNRKHTRSFGISSLLLAIAPLWLILLAAVNTPAHAQASPPSWVQAFGSSGTGNNISNATKVGPDQNLYVVGQFSSTADFGGTKLTSAGGLDIFVAKYSSSGALQWVAQAGGTGDDAARGVDLDTDGNVYVTGSFSGVATFYSANPKDKKITVDPGAGNGGTFLAKYTSSGTLLWVQTGISLNYGIAGYGVAVDAAAQTVYIAAQASQVTATLSSADGTNHVVIGANQLGLAFMMLAKYDTNGNFQWVQTGAACCGALFPLGVAVDGENNAYAFGWFQGCCAYFDTADGPLINVNGFGPSDTFLVKYDKNGDFKWMNDIGGYKAEPGAVTIGSSGEITLVGFIGNINYGSPSEAETIVSSQPPGTNISLGGGIFTNPYNIDEVIATYNPAGVLIRALRRGASGNENATGVAYDSRDNLYVTGLVEGNDQPQLFLDEYSGKNLLWEATADAGIWTGQAATTTPALAVDAAGSFFVTGGYVGTASFGDIKLNGTGASEAFVAELNTAFANQSADLLLRLYASPAPVKQGNLLTFTFPVWNRGPNVAYLESLKTQVPEGTTFDYIRISGTPGLGTCTHPPYQGTGEIVCDENSAMAPNTTWTLRLTVKVTAPAGSVITETGTVMQVTPDPKPSDATSRVNVAVE